MIVDPQIRHDNMIIEIDEPGVGSFETTEFPVDMSATPASVKRPPPRVGEHTCEVPRETGYDDSTVNLVENRRKAAGDSHRRLMWMFKENRRRSRDQPHERSPILKISE